MARYLELPPSQVSETLNGKANFSVKTGRRIAHKLGLGPREEDFFCLLIQIETEADPQIRERLIERLRELHSSGREVADIDIDAFRQIADWYHVAILELPNLVGFTLTPERAARKLGISVHEARVALDRLERLGLLAKDAQGNWFRPNNNLQVTAPNKNAAFRTFYHQMLEKIGSAVDEQEPFKERIGGFQTIPISKKALPEIDRAFDRFFEEAIRIARRYPDKTEVYHLGVHFVSLTHEDAKRRKKPCAKPAS